MLGEDVLQSPRDFGLQPELLELADEARDERKVERRKVEGRAWRGDRDWSSRACSVELLHQRKYLLQQL